MEPPPKESAWRVPVLRALIQGDVPVVEQYCRKHPEAIHTTFTRRMTDWQLELEAYRYFEFQGCTALFVSASMGHVELTDWLLEMGADPTVGDTKKRLPAECVGESLDDEALAAKGEELAELRALLEAKRRTTKAPPPVRVEMKSHWHSWTEKIPYTLSKYRVDMEVGEQGGPRLARARARPPPLTNPATPRRPHDS